MEKWIFFDMDGTLNKFYEVINWLLKLRAFDPSPYEDAAVNLNMSLLARYLHILQEKGYKIGIISWLAKESNETYDAEVSSIKNKWLKLHIGSVEFDAIYIVPYGVPKHSLRKSTHDILFDDSTPIRIDWGLNAYPPEQILSVLKALIKEG